MFGMYRNKFPFIVDKPYEIASIDIREAHILWKDGDDRFGYLPGKKYSGAFVAVFRIRSLEDINFQEKNNYCGYSDTGACWTAWKDRPIHDLVTECKEMMIEFMIRGMDPIIVVREFGKIRQIVEEGGNSFWMGRSLSMAFQGMALDSLDQWQFDATF